MKCRPGCGLTKQAPRYECERDGGSQRLDERAGIPRLCVLVDIFRWGDPILYHDGSLVEKCTRYQPLGKKFAGTCGYFFFPDNFRALRNDLLQHTFKPTYP